MKLDPKISDVEHVVPGSECPRCSKFMDRATCVSDKASPEEGDCTICIGCGQWLVFCEGLTIRTMEEEDIAQLPQDAFRQLSKAGRALAQIKRGEKQ